MEKARPSTRLFEGALWKIFSMACFAGINGVVRYLSGGAGPEEGPHLPVNVIMFFQNVIGMLFLLPWTLKSELGTLKTAFPVLHFARVLTAVVGVYLWYLSLAVMPIAEGVALSFTGPIFTVIAAWFVLNEGLGLQRFIAIAICLVGAFFITRPDIPLLGGDHPIGIYAVFPISSAVFLAISKLATRKLATLGEKPSTLATYLLIFMTPASLLLAIFEWQTPTWTDMGWLTLLGFLAALAHLSFARAFALADVTFLTPFGFTKFLMSALVGYLAFAELSKNMGLWLGSALIAISILLISYELPFKSARHRREA